jgi:hypothetical protein
MALLQRNGRNMAFKRAMLRMPHWWIELIGVVLLIIAMFIMPPGSARLILGILGLDFSFLVLSQCTTVRSERPKVTLSFQSEDSINATVHGTHW